jgi:hypothetical protein
VHDENELAVRGGEEQALTTPPSSGEAATFECSEQWFCRLQSRQVGRAGMLDQRDRDRLVERAAKSLDFGQLGQFRSRA